MSGQPHTGEPHTVEPHTRESQTGQPHTAQPPAAGDSGAPEADLLVVYHSRSGSTRRLCEAVMRGVREAAPGFLARAVGAFDAGPEDVLAARAVILGTPANFGYMSGALKDFFERVYHRCLEHTQGLPYCLIVKGDTDVNGAVASVERIVTGMAWKRLLPPLTVVGDIAPSHLDGAWEMGATVAAGLEAGIF